MLLGSAQVMTKSARWVPRRLWRLGWTGPGRGTARLATNSSTSPITYTLARARVTTSRQKTLLTHVTPHSRRHTSSFLDTRRSALAAQHICLISNLRRTGHDGAFRPVGHRAQPGRLLQRKHGLVRARCLARGPNFFVLVYMWPRLGLWRLSIPQPTICVRRSLTRVREKLFVAKSTSTRTNYLSWGPLHTQEVEQGRSGLLVIEGGMGPAYIGGKAS